MSNLIYLHYFTFYIPLYSQLYVGLKSSLHKEYFMLCCYRCYFQGGVQEEQNYLSSNPMFISNFYIICGGCKHHDMLGKSYANNNQFGRSLCCYTYHLTSIICSQRRHELEIILQVTNQTAKRNKNLLNHDWC